MEYASSAWSTAAVIKLDNLNKTQNTGLRLITGAMKTTPISAMEKTAGLLSLEERREEKLLRQSEKIKTSFTPPYIQSLRRLQRTDSNPQMKALQREHLPPLPTSNQPLEFLQDHEDWQHDTPTTIFDIPGINKKNATQKKNSRPLHWKL